MLKRQEKRNLRLRNEVLKKQNIVNKEEDEFESMEVDELKAYAIEKNIDIGNATSKNGIIKKIKEQLE